MSSFEKIFNELTTDPILCKNREKENQYGLSDITLRLAIEANVLNTSKTRASELTDEECRTIFQKVHWIHSGCEEMRYPLNLIHFDAILDLSISKGLKGLQVTINTMRNYGAVRVNGFWDQGTRNALQKLTSTDMDLLQFCIVYLELREEFYKKGALKRSKYKLTLPDKIDKINRLDQIVTEEAKKLGISIDERK